MKNSTLVVLEEGNDFAVPFAGCCLNQFVILM
jgi:hypothetical protein